MGYFGLVSPHLPAAAYWKRLEWIPQRWRYREGFAFAGKILGSLGNEPLEGWGWAVAKRRRPEYTRLWQAFDKEWATRQVQVVGVDGLSLNCSEIPVRVGLSDGKSLELLIFAQQFENILRYYRINPQSAEIAIVWEEGNLGLACARLIAQRLRFLRLIHPNINQLDHAAAVLMAETGISPKTQQVMPGKEKRISMFICCGELNQYRSWLESSDVLCWQLFSGRLDLFQRLLGEAFFTAWGSSVHLPTSPVLGETLIRVMAGWSSEQWIGSNLRLERVALLQEFIDKWILEGLA